VRTLEALAVVNADLAARIARTHALAAALAADTAAGCFTSSPALDDWRERYAVAEHVALIGGGL